jgi:hypothetical protein
MFPDHALDMIAIIRGWAFHDARPCPRALPPPRLGDESSASSPQGISTRAPVLLRGGLRRLIAPRH